jgi:outer membrane protein assembly factor BamA
VHCVPSNTAFPLVIFLSILGWASQGMSQSAKPIIWKIEGEIRKPVNYPRQASSGLQMKRISEKVLSVWHGEGFLQASAQIKEDSSTFHVQIVAGKQWLWIQLSPGNVSEEWLQKAGFRERFYKNKPFRHQELSRLIEGILAISENNGYPFAELTFDSLVIGAEVIGARLRLEPGPLITFDTLKYPSAIGVDVAYLIRHTGIVPGTPFNQKLLDEVAAKVGALPFVKVVGPMEVYFRLDKAEVSIPLERRKSSRFDGILGFLPNELEQGRLLMTGQVDLALSNLGGKGRSLDFEWLRLKPQSQTLLLAYQHPYLLGSPLTPSGSFFLLKEDSSFINRKGTLELQVRSGGYSSLSFFGEFSSARLLETTGPRAEQIGLADFNLNAYGIRYLWQKFDNSINPKKGWGLKMEGSGGNKRLLRNANIDPSYLASFPEKSFQGQMALSVNGYLPLGRYLVFTQGIQAGVIYNPKALFLNDLQRIGGLQSIRGFNENFFFASQYAISRMEGRWYFEEDSYFLAFYDQGFLTYSLRNSSFSDHPAGLGGGIALMTAGGQLMLVYALGTSKTQPFGTNLSKIHFGYVARF